MKLILTLAAVLHVTVVVQASQLSFTRSGGRQESGTSNPLAHLSKVIEKARVDNGVPGYSVAVLYKNKLVFAEGFGKRNEHDPFTAETIAPIASLSKAFTAAAIGELVGEGRMDWDRTPISKYLPEFELEDPILTSQLTLVDLLSHRSGFPDVSIAWEGSTESRKDLIKRLKYFKTDSKLLPDVRYNNVMYSVAGEAGANVANMSYEDLVRTKIIRPLGLTNTGISNAEMTKTRSNYAAPFEAASFEDAQSGIFKRFELDLDFDPNAASGDIHTNVLDLARWGNIIMHYGQHPNGTQALNKDSVSKLLTAHSIYTNDRRTPEFPPSATYGMGWVLDSYKGNVMYHHSGHVPGYISTLTLFPDSEVVIAQLSNAHLTALPLFIGYHIMDELFDLPRTQNWIEVVQTTTREMYEDAAKMEKGQYPKRIENKPANHGLSEFVGLYTHKGFGEISVRKEQKSSATKEGEQDALFIDYLWFRDSQLSHYHFDTFSVFFQHTVIRFRALVSFSTGSDGQIDGLVVEGGDIPMEFKKTK